MPRCIRCKEIREVEGWKRYERNGKLKALCPDCDARAEHNRERNATANSWPIFRRDVSPASGWCPQLADP